MAFFGGTSFGGLFGPAQQQSFRPQIVGIDTSLIAMSVDAQIAQRTLSSLTAEQRAAYSFGDRGDAVIPPWQLPEETKTLNQQIREVRSLTKFIDLKADDLDAVSGDKDKKATFALYKALENLRILAEYASQNTTSLSSLSRLNDQFQKGLSEVRDFLSTADLDKLDLFLGEKQYKTETTTRLGKNGTEANGSLITNDPNAAIDGLVGNEVFTVSITKSGVTDDIVIDLSNVTGTLSLNNIKDYINTQIEALTILDGNGDPVPKHSTLFDVRRDGDSGRYSLQIDGTLTEEVTLSAAVSTPTLYVASAVSQLDDDFAVTSRITEINGLDGTLAVDDVTSFTGIDYAASEIKEKVAAQEEDDLDPAIASLRDKMLADAKVDVLGDAANNDTAVDNELSITNVNSDYQVNADTAANRVAVDSQGGIYVVGTSEGSFGHQINTASGEDVFLTKFDTEGNVVFSRLLGVAGDADAYGITVDSEDNVIVVGKTDSELSTSDVIDSTDAFVTKISKRGDEIFRYQLDTFGESAAYSVAVDSNNDIYVGGYTKSGISATSGFSGGQDALVLKLSGADGSLQDSSVFGTAGNDVVKGIVVDKNDNLVVAVEEGGNAKLYRLDTTNLADTSNSLDFGSLGTGGSIQGIAIDNINNDVYIAGVTTSAALDAGGTASVVGTANGGFEGFVSAVSLNGQSNLKAESTTYLSTAGTDRINDVVVVDQVVYVAGSTASAFAGETAKSSVDGFVARIDGKTGAIQDTEQFGESLSRSAVGGLAFTTKGNSVLETLGLPTGTIAIDETLDVKTQTTAKTGDFFYLSIDGGTKKKITLQEGDTFDDLARKLRIAGFGKIDVDVSSTAEGDKLTIATVDNGVSIDLLPGTGDRDLLQRIGLEPGKLLPKDEVYGLNKEDEDSDPADPDNLGGAFGLGLGGALHIEDKATAKYVLGLLDKAINNVQRAFRSLEYDPLKEMLKNGNRAAEGTVPPYLQNQLANFQTGLARLQTGSSSPAVSLFV